MRRQALLWFIAAAALAAASGARASTKADWDACNSNDIAKVVAGCDKVIEDKTEAPDRIASAYVNRGLAYQATGDIDGAIEDYTEAAKLDPKSPDAFWLRGMAYENTGDLVHAIADFDKTIALQPNFADARNERATAYYTVGEIDKALADFAEAIRINPNEVIYYGNRATVYHSKGDFPRAAGDYSEVVSRDPTANWAFLGRGIAALYSGDMAKALADVTHAAEISPRDAYSALWVEILRQRSGMPSALAAAAEKLDMKNWPAPVVRLYLGQTTATAVQIAAESNVDPIRGTNQLCEADFYLGAFALRAGAKDEAARRFKNAAACPPDFFEGSPAKAELKALGATP